MNERGLTRRQLLGRTLWAGGSLAAFGGLSTVSRLAQAAEGAEIYYVFAYFSGGWDILLGLDPRDPAVFNAENMRNTRIQPGYELLQNSTGELVRAGNLAFGPFIGDLANHASRLAVVRGMSMETLTHEAGRRRFLTGKPPSGLQARGSSTATYLAANFGRAQPIPNLAIQVESYNVDNPNYASALRANGVPDLIRALRPSTPGLGPNQAEQLDHLLAQAAECRIAEHSPVWQSAEAARKKAREMVDGRLDRLFDFNAPGDAMAAIRAQYGIPAGTAGLTSPEAQAAMAAQAIKGGVSRVVSIQVANGLDTHFNDWARDQGPRQRQGFNAIARLLDDLSSSQYRDTSETWLDHTVVVGFSEFSRTSMLNARDGRDHSLTNACFLAGAGIKGNVAVGASSDIGMEPQAIDLVSGLPALDGQVIRPEHILQTLLHNAGLDGDIADLRVPSVPALKA